MLRGRWCPLLIFAAAVEPSSPRSPKAPAKRGPVNNNCSQLTLSKVAVPTGIQPIFSGMGGPVQSLGRLLGPCNTDEGACSVGLDGCVVSNGSQQLVIGKCNATHGVEYQHRMPGDGEAAIVSFFNPSATSLRTAFAAIERARPRLYIEFEPPAHARVPQRDVLRHVDGLMTYSRSALVRYPYFTPTHLWQLALRHPSTTPGFSARRAAIAVFVSNCRGHRLEAIEWLRRHFEVHSFGACKRSGANITRTVNSTRARLTHVEGGHLPECLAYRAVLAIENNACEDYVTEKLLKAVQCGAVPIVRTKKGLPDYLGLVGRLPLLDAASLDDAFEARVRAVLTDRAVWEAHLPAYSRQLGPSAEELGGPLAVHNPHCQLIEVIERFRSNSSEGTGMRSATPIRCETFYHVSGPRGIQRLPRNASRERRQANSTNITTVPRHNGFAAEEAVLGGVQRTISG